MSLKEKNKGLRKHGSTVNILKRSFLLTEKLPHDLLEKACGGKKKEEKKPAYSCTSVALKLNSL